MLNFVHHHQSVELLQGKLGNRQSFDLRGVFEIEIVEVLIAGKCPRPDYLAREGGFARLTWPEQGDDWRVS